MRKLCFAAVLLLPACGGDGGGGATAASGPPTVSALTPRGAPTGGKFRVTGSDFAGASDVRIGGVACAFAVEGPTSILATVPAGADTGTVVVTNPFGDGASSVPLRVVTAAKINAALALHSSNSGTGLVFLYEFPGQPTLVFHESYQSGDAATLRLVASATKTLNGILFAAALDDGIIASPDEKVSDYITEWEADPLKESITLRQLLTLSSGLDSGGELTGMNFADAVNRPLSADTIANGVGTEFVYGADPFQVFNLYLLRRMGLPTNPTALGATSAAVFNYDAPVLPMGVAWLKERVNSKPGVWKWGAIGTAPNEQDPGMGGGARFTTMELARMAQFLMNRGAQTYGGTQVIAADCIDLLSTPTPFADPTPSNPLSTYGTCAWIGYGGQSPPSGTPPASLWSAAGAGKNMAWVLPEFRMALGRNAAVPAGATLDEHAFFVALGLTE